MEYIDISDPSIMGGKFQKAVRNRILEICGLNLHQFLALEKDKQEVFLKKEFLELNYSKILEYFEKVYGTDMYSINNRIAYQVFGFLLLKTNSHIPNWLKSSIIEASKWKHEKQFWPDDLKKERVEILREFRNEIRSYKQGEFESISDDSTVKDIKKIIQRALETSNSKLLQKNLLYPNFKKIFIEEINEILNKYDEKKSQLGLSLVGNFLFETTEPELNFLIGDSKPEFLEIIEKCTVKSTGSPFWDDYLADHVGVIFSGLIKEKIETAVKMNDYDSLSFILYHKHLELLNKDDAYSLFKNDELGLTEYIVRNLHKLDKDSILSMFGLRLSNKIEGWISKYIESSTIEILKIAGNNWNLSESLIELDLISYLTEENVAKLLLSEDIDLLNILLGHRCGDSTELNISLFLKKHKFNIEFIKSEILKAFINTNLRRIYRFVTSHSFDFFSIEEIRNLIKDPQMDISRKILSALMESDDFQLNDWANFFQYTDEKYSIIYNKLKSQIHFFESFKLLNHEISSMLALEEHSTDKENFFEIKELLSKCDLNRIEIKSIKNLPQTIHFAKFLVNYLNAKYGKFPTGYYYYKESAKRLEKYTKNLEIFSRGFTTEEKKDMKK